MKQTVDMSGMLDSGKSEVTSKQTIKKYIITLIPSFIAILFLIVTEILLIKVYKNNPTRSFYTHFVFVISLVLLVLSTISIIRTEKENTFFYKKSTIFIVAYNVIFSLIIAITSFFMILSYFVLR
ncbi:MAG: hypothetical protein LBV51_05685 [Acholeplasmatales bacterium]|jgi:hypothetical protein|nr:hypothetical protein [Acholeplasmatales bacterium]